ncbi:hypothetical protein PVAG01_10547 [Phlyctema vagabunda]|uniref:Uncharacterized protein n=1 Tax=Phlyctema vagabunda TaxID=108571 RepID=A0ABR4P2L6_9HELO
MAATKASSVKLYDVHSLNVAPFDEKAAQAWNASKGAVPSREDFLDALATAHAGRKVKNVELYLPRQEVIDAVQDTLRGKEVAVPEGYPSDLAQWKLNCRRGYKFMGTDSVLYLEKHALGSSACITPIEDGHKIIVAAHVDATTGKHLGRDATYLRVLEVSESLTKGFVAAVIARCPHERCAKAGVVGKTSGVQREQKRREQNPQGIREKQTAEQRKERAMQGRIEKKARRELAAKETQRAVSQAAAMDPGAFDNALGAGPGDASFGAWQPIFSPAPIDLASLPHGQEQQPFYTDEQLAELLTRAVHGSVFAPPPSPPPALPSPVAYAPPPVEDQYNGNIDSAFSDLNEVDEKWLLEVSENAAKRALDEYYFEQSLNFNGDCGQPSPPS